MNNTETGFLIFMEDQTDPNVVGVCWGQQGTIDTLLNLYREQRPNAQFANFTSCTFREYVSVLPALDTVRLGGVWYRRPGVVDHLIRTIEAEQLAEIEALEAEWAEQEFQSKQKAHHKYEATGYAAH